MYRTLRIASCQLPGLLAQPYTRPIRTPIRAVLPSSFTLVKSHRYASTSSQAKSDEPATEDEPSHPRSPPDLDHLARLVERTEAMFIKQVGIPPEAMTIHALKSLYTVANAISDRHVQPQPVNPKQPLLDIGGALTTTASQSPRQLRKATAQRVSQAAFTIVSAPNVIVTEAITKLYVGIHTELRIASTIAEVLAMYQNKPLPVQKNGRITYESRFKYRLDAYIDPDLADHALQVALYAKDLDAAINITDICFCSTGFYTHKLARALTLPSVFAIGVPPMAWLLAGKFAEMNDMIDPIMASGFTFTGIMAYILFTGSIGLISNLSNADHMVRVTWIPGTPYRKRWLREEERLALDKISMTWGFRDAWKHGEETGPEWGALKEWIGLRGMLLDRVEFMENMN